MESKDLDIEGKVEVGAKMVNTRSFSYRESQKNKQKKYISYENLTDFDGLNYVKKHEEFEPAIKARINFIDLVYDLKIRDLQVTGKLVEPNSDQLYLNVDQLGQLTLEDVNEICSKLPEIPLAKKLELRLLLNSILSTTNSYEKWKTNIMPMYEELCELKNEDEIADLELLEPFSQILKPGDDEFLKKVLAELSDIESKLNTAATINTLTLGVPFSVLGLLNSDFWEALSKRMDQYGCGGKKLVIFINS